MLSFLHVVDEHFFDFAADISWALLRQVEVLVHVVSALFDINPSMSTHMAPALWRRCIGVLFEV